MLNPLPAIALLPLALLWFGLGNGSLVFVLIHSVLWVVALNTHSGFLGVSQTLRMVGRNYGLRGFRYVLAILIPAAFPSILTGLKVGWAFAWRTLIAAELVFGVSSGSGGLGWFIFENKNQLEIPSVFAGLLSVILIGLAVENLVFRWIEARTVRTLGHAELRQSLLSRRDERGRCSSLACRTAGTLRRRLPGAATRCVRRPAVSPSARRRWSSRPRRNRTGSSPVVPSSRRYPSCHKPGNRWARGPDTAIGSPLPAP